MERTPPVPKKTRSHEDHQNLLERGFTLVELLIVIVILGILAGIVVFAVGNVTSNAKTNACSTEKSTISTALEAYKANTGAYPVDGVSPIKAIDMLTGGNGATPPAGVGVLLKTVPTGYTITSGTGAITAIAGNANGCT
jgi:prepilin-type N-terminal cleavage/methylation domain-containing protein